MAQALDGGSISVTAPLDPSQRVDYLSILENLEVEVGRAVAKVIINSRTGTIVIGQNVRVQPAAVTHGSLTVTISEDPQVSQPGPFGRADGGRAQFAGDGRAGQADVRSAPAPRWTRSSVR